MKPVLVNSSLAARWACALLLTTSACSSDDTDVQEGTRAVSGLDRCTVRLPGYYHVLIIADFSVREAENAENGMTQALVEINEAGGVDGRPVGWIACDVSDEQEDELWREIDGLDNTHVRVFVGDFTGFRQTSYLDQTWRNEMPLIVGAVVEEGESVEGTPFTFPIAVPDDFEPAGLFTLLAEEGHTDAVIFTNALANAVEAQLDRDGINYDRVSGGGVTDYFASATDRAEPDAVVILAGDELEIHDGASVLGWSSQFYSSRSSLTATLLAANPSNLLGTRALAPRADGGFETFNTDYIQLWGTFPNEIAIVMYEVAYSSTAALLVAEERDNGTSVRDAFARIRSGQSVSIARNWSRIQELASTDGEFDLQGIFFDLDFGSSAENRIEIQGYALDSDLVLRPLEPCYSVGVQLDVGDCE
ncbi:MAG: ABC transporter substrate-binding protein [Myxococcota bacterium]